MFSLILIIIALSLFLWEEISSLNDFYSKNRYKQKELETKLTKVRKKEDFLSREITALEQEINNYFFMYELIRKTAPILDKSRLTKVFFSELNYFGELKILDKKPDGGKFIEFNIDKGGIIKIIKTKSVSILNNLPYFNHLLNICVERINLYNKFQQLSVYDSLTKTTNRRYFMKRYSEEFSRAKKFGLKFSLLMLDIDHFKKVNDTYGHLVGDVVLKKAAKLIKQNIREIDSVGRFGGEEFIVLLPETDRAGAIIMAERIRNKISFYKLEAFDETMYVTVSIGVSSYPKNAFHYDVLLEVADKALYKAQKEGRNRVCWF